MCYPLENIDKTCGFSLSSIKEIYITEYKEDLNYILINDDLFINEILDFKVLKCDKDSGSLSYSIDNTPNGFLGSVSVTGTFQKLDKTKYNKLLKLLNKKLYVLVKDMNNLYWFIGVDSGAKVKNILATTGTKGQFNGLTLNIVSTSSIPYNLSSIVYEGEFDEGFDFGFLTA